MPGILADNNVEGHFEELLWILRSSDWLEIWNGLGLTVETFESLGLARNAPDVEVWRVCQEREVLLVTGNRHAEGPDSLELTIRMLNTPNSLPVITIADPSAFRGSKRYVARVAVRLLEYLMDLDACRGTGRLYIP